MTKNYYLKTLKNNTSIETIDIMQATVNDFESVCQANILKYVMRAIDKHDNPQADIKKIIDYCNFWLNHLSGKMATTDRNTHAPFKKMEELLNSQEKGLIDLSIHELDNNQKIVLEYFLSNVDNDCLLVFYEFTDAYYNNILDLKIEEAYMKLTDRSRNEIILTLIKTLQLDKKDEVLELLKNEREINKKIKEALDKKIEEELSEKNEIKRLISELNDNQMIVLEYMLDIRIFNSEDPLYYILYSFFEDYFRYDLPTDIDDVFRKLKEQEINCLLLILIKLESLGVHKEVLEIVKNERELDEVLRKTETMNNLATLMNNLKKGSSDKDWNTK